MFKTALFTRALERLNCGVKSGAFLRMTAYFTVFFYILQRFIRRNEGDTRLNDAVFWRGWLAILHTPKNSAPIIPDVLAHTGAD